MANESWHYLENQFDGVTRESRKRMDAILADTFPKLVAGTAANSAIAPLVTILTPAKTAWDTVYGQWANARAASRAATQQVENLLFVLRREPAPGERSHVDAWESRLSAEWARSHAVYAYLLPQGREPFTLGTREQMIGAVEQFGKRLTDQAGKLQAEAAQPGLAADKAARLTRQATLLTELAGDVSAFFAQLDAARDAQQQREGELDGLSGQVEAARVIAATALYKVLGSLMAIFAEPPQRSQVTAFFDLTLIMNPPKAGEDEEEELPADPVPPAGGGGVVG